MNGELLRRDATRTLKDGDLIQIGDFEIRVSTGAGRGRRLAPRESPTEAQERGTPEQPADPSTSPRGSAQETSAPQAPSPEEPRLSDERILGLGTRPQILEDWGKLVGHQAPGPEHVRGTPPAEPVPRIVPGTDRERARIALRSFLRGAGLTESDLPALDEAAFMELAGAVLRGLLQGVMEMLSARDTLASAMHLSMASVNPIENNPLKLSATLQEALHQLLLEPASKTVTAQPAQLVREAVDEINAYQLATLAGL